MLPWGRGAARAKEAARSAKEERRQSLSRGRRGSSKVGPADGAVAEAEETLVLPEGIRRRADTDTTGGADSGAGIGAVAGEDNGAGIGAGSSSGGGTEQQWDAIERFEASNDSN